MRSRTVVRVAGAVHLSVCRHGDVSNGSAQTGEEILLVDLEIMPLDEHRLHPSTQQVRPYREYSNKIRGTEITRRLMPVKIDDDRDLNNKYNNVSFTLLRYIRSQRVFGLKRDTAQTR